MHKQMGCARWEFGIAGLVFLGFAAFVLISRQPLQGSLFPPYGMKIIPEDSFGPLHGWSFDLAICLILSLFGLGAWAILGLYKAQDTIKGNSDSEDKGK